MRYHCVWHVEDLIQIDLVSEGVQELVAQGLLYHNVPGINNGRRQFVLQIFVF